MLDHYDIKTCQEAVRTKDARFDGKFFSAVKTTGIYCRTICPATPLLKNIEFFQTTIAAELNGYRPCLRCRPEAAPGSDSWSGKSSLVQRAIKKISNNSLGNFVDEEFAAQFNISARHLRRIFHAEMGITPKQLIDSERLNFSRKLLCETSLAITEIVGMAGFSSTRRFNDAFKKRFQRSPLQFRKLYVRKSNYSAASIKMKLAFRPPLDWERTLEFFRFHTIKGVQNVQNSCFERVFTISHKVIAMRVSRASHREIGVEVFGECRAHLQIILSRVKQMFDLDADLQKINRAFDKNKALKTLLAKRPGLRLIGHWDFYESCICTILGQLVSVTQANKLIAELVKAYGTKVIHPIDGSEALLFPNPETIARAGLSELATSEKRKNTLCALAMAIHLKELPADGEMENSLLRERLLAIPGIGPWTVDYVFLRALGNTNSFPHTDLALKKALIKYPSLKGAKYSPWKAYIAVHLWADYAANLNKRNGKK